jgi:hypothetical protein
MFDSALLSLCSARLPKYVGRHRRFGQDSLIPMPRGAELLPIPLGRLRGFLFMHETRWRKRASQPRSPRPVHESRSELIGTDSFVANHWFLSKVLVEP